MEGLLDARLRAVVTRAASYDWCVTEFVRVTNTVLPPRSFQRVCPELLNHSKTPSGTPARVQLLGSDPNCLAENADQLAKLAPAGIDLNFGCPAPTVNRHRGGAVLLDETELLHEIASSVNRAIAGRVPFTAKMRLGVHDTDRAIEAAQALADGGAEMLVVHARTKADGYRPPAHWPWIARIAESVKVPVVANGEIWTADDYRQCRAESGMSDVMLGRGAVADPFLVERIRNSTTGEDYWHRVVPLIDEYWQLILQHVKDRGIEPRHAPGRLKQWLNMLRRAYPQAGIVYEELKLAKTLSECSAALDKLIERESATA